MSLAVMLKGLAPARKETAASRMELESDGSVMADVANVAMSGLSSGTVSGVQFGAVFQSLLVGVALHVALSAEADWQITQSKMPGKKDQKRFLERIPRFSESKG